MHSARWSLLLPLLPLLPPLLLCVLSPALFLSPRSSLSLSSFFFLFLSLDLVIFFFSRMTLSKDVGEAPPLIFLPPLSLQSMHQENFSTPLRFHLVEVAHERLVQFETTQPLVLVQNMVVDSSTTQ
jgi:hypothetical protein